MGIDRDSPSVQTYLEMQQVVITRLAGNSASCKTWCVTLVTAIAALGVNAREHGLVLLAFLPIAIFFLLDSYYLALERDFRHRYDTFVERIHQGKAEKTELFQLKLPSGRIRRLGTTLQAVFSPSVLPFYVILSMAVIVTYFFAVGQTS